MTLPVTILKNALNLNLMHIEKVEDATTTSHHSFSFFKKAYSGFRTVLCPPDISRDVPVI